MEKTFVKKTPIDTDEGWQLTKLTVDLKQKVMIEEWKVPCNCDSYSSRPGGGHNGDDGKDGKDDKGKGRDRSRTPEITRHGSGTPEFPRSRTPEITRR